MTKTTQYDIIVAERAKRMLGIYVRLLSNVGTWAAQKTKSVIMTAVPML